MARRRSKTPSTRPKTKYGTEKNHFVKDENPVNFRDYLNRNPRITESVANIPWNRPLGNAFNLWKPNEYAEKIVEPGIMLLPIYYGPGQSWDNSSIVNVASKAMYSFVRHENSGHSNYDPADLMLYNLSVDSIYVWYAVLKRLYGTFMAFNAFNRYYPRMIIRVMGFDYDSIASNLPRLRTIINTMTKKLGALCIPPLNLFGLHREMFSHLYMDNLNSKAQTYIFRPAGLYFYHEDYDPVKDISIGSLQWKDWGYIPGATTTVAYYTLDQIEIVTNWFFQNLMGSEDIGIMSGDVLKAYGKTDLYVLEQVDVDYECQVIQSNEVLSMIENAIPLGAAINLDITQNPEINEGAILWDPVFTAMDLDNNFPVWNAVIGGNRMINIHDDDTSPERIMVSTALTPGEDNGFPVLGTMFLKNVTIYSFDNSNPNNMVYRTLHLPVTGHGSAAATLQDLDLMTAFRTVPFYAYITQDGTTHSVNVARAYVETDNYTIVAPLQMNAIHQAATLSLWDVPEMNISQ